MQLVQLIYRQTVARIIVNSVSSRLRFVCAFSWRNQRESEILKSLASADSSLGSMELVQLIYRQTVARIIVNSVSSRLRFVCAFSWRNQRESEILKSLASADSSLGSMELVQLIYRQTVANSWRSGSKLLDRAVDPDPYIFECWFCSGSRCLNANNLIKWMKNFKNVFLHFIIFFSLFWRKLVCQQFRMAQNLIKYQRRYCLFSSAKGGGPRFKTSANLGSGSIYYKTEP